MGGLATAARALLTRRIDARTVVSYAVLIGLVAGVVVLGAVILIDQIGSL